MLLFRESPETKIVSVAVDGRTVSLQTQAATVGELLEECAVQIADGDLVHPDGKSSVSDNMIVEVIRSFPVYLEVDGRRLSYRTTGITVAELLRHFNVTLADEDVVEPAPGTRLVESATVFVTRIRSTYETKVEQLPYGIRFVKDPNLLWGREVVARPGEVGLRSTTYRRVYTNGRLTGEYLVKDVIKKQPVDRIIRVGRKLTWHRLKTRIGTLYYRYKVTMEASAYYPGAESTGIYADGITATGHVAGHGVVAVDPDYIPLGTRLYIPGYGLALAADVGGAIKGNRIDLCFDTYFEAQHYGRRYVTVYVDVVQHRPPGYDE